MDKLTNEEAADIYGEVPCKFAGYYKYTFHFSGTAVDGATIKMSIGGDHDDTYRFSVDRDQAFFLGNAYSTEIKKDGVILYERSSW